jgi:uncharacterized protein (TIRG00374 family)
VNSPAKSLWRNARRWMPGLLISIVALVAVFRMARWEDIKLALSSIRPLNLGIAVVITLISMVTRAVAWQILLNQKTTLRKAFFIINEGYFLNNLFPLRAGEIGRAVFMGQASGLGPFHVLSTIVLERAFDLAMAAGLLLTTLPLALGMSWALPVASFTLILVAAGIFFLFLIARNTSKVHAWVSKLGLRWPIVQKWVIPQLDALLDGLSTLTQPWKFFSSVFLIFLSWAMWVSMYYIMLLPLAPHLPYWAAMFTTGVLAMGLAIPAAPGGLGVYEASVVGALAIFGITPSVSLAYALMMHFLQFTITGIFGFIELVRSRNSISSLFDQMQIRNESVH